MMSIGNMGHVQKQSCQRYDATLHGRQKKLEPFLTRPTRPHQKFEYESERSASVDDVMQCYDVGVLEALEERDYGAALEHPTLATEKCTGNERGERGVVENKGGKRE